MKVGGLCYLSSAWDFFLLVRGVLIATWAILVVFNRIICTNVGNRIIVFAAVLTHHIKFFASVFCHIESVLDNYIHIYSENKVIL